LTAEPAEAGQSAPAGDRWFVALIVVTVLLHTATAQLRPMLSYRALDIGVEPEFLGIVAAAFAIAPLVAALWIGRVVDRGKERGFAVGGTILFGLSALAIALQPSLPVLLVGSAVMGLGHLGAIVATQALVASGTGAKGLDRRFAHVALAASVGHLLGPALGGVIAADGSSGGITAALFVGGLVALAAVPFSFGMRANASKERTENQARAAVPLKAILTAPGMMPTMLASLTVMAGMDILMVYLPALGEEVGWSPLTVGALLAVRAAASIVSRLGLGMLGDRLGRANLLIWCLGLSAAGLVGLALAPGLPAAFVAVAIAGFALGLGQPLTVASVAAIAAPGTRATALSVRMMGNRLSQVAVPITAGLLAGVSGVAGVLVLTGAALAATTAVMVGGNRTAAQATDAG
jgi:MFS family permease